MWQRVRAGDEGPYSLVGVLDQLQLSSGMWSPARLTWFCCRHADFQAELPVIVITGQADAPLAVEAMRSGAVDFLEKPVDDDVLLASIRSALRAREIEHSRESEQRKFAQRVEALSRREREVLEGKELGCNFL